MHLSFCRWIAILLCGASTLCPRRLPAWKSRSVRQFLTERRLVPLELRAHSRGRFTSPSIPSTWLTATSWIWLLRPATLRAEFTFQPTYVLRPVDLNKGNKTILFEVVNRGGKGALATFNRAESSADPRRPASSETVCF